MMVDCCMMLMAVAARKVVADVLSTVGVLNWASRAVAVEGVASIGVSLRQENCLANATPLIGSL
jgi:hypothetical protein